MAKRACGTLSRCYEVCLLLIASTFVVVERCRRPATVVFADAETNNNGLPSVKRNIPLTSSPLLRASFDDLESSSDFEDVLFDSPIAQTASEVETSETVRRDGTDEIVEDMDESPSGESEGTDGNGSMNRPIHEQASAVLVEADAVAAEITEETQVVEEERPYDGVSTEPVARTTNIDMAHSTDNEKMGSQQVSSTQGDSDGDSASDENNSDEESFVVDDYFADFDSDLSVQLDQVDRTAIDDGQQDSESSAVQTLDQTASEIEDPILHSNQIESSPHEDAKSQPAQSTQPVEEASMHVADPDKDRPAQSLPETFSPAAADAEAAAREAQVSSQPLRTLRKLQHMLDETDYMTAMPHQQRTAKQRTSPLLPHQAEGRQGWSQNPQPRDHLRQQLVQQPPQLPPPTRPVIERRIREQDQGTSTPPPTLEREAPQRLWTSGDRRKYKMQQRVQRRVQEEQRRLVEQRRLAEERRRLMEQEELHQSATSSDDEATSDPDDGLGFTLPNLPVYMSDAEGATTDAIGDDAEAVAPPYQQRQQQTVPPHQPPPPPPRFPQHQAQYPQQQIYQRQQQQSPPYGMPPPYMGYPPPPQGANPYQYPNPYGSLSPQQQQLLAAQFASAWASASPYGTYPPPAFQPKRYAAPDSVLRPPTGTMQGARQSIAPNEMQQGALDQPLDARGSPVAVPMLETSTLAEASAKINFDSIQKITIMFICVVTLCYCAVSPRNLPLVKYNEKFNENLRIVSFLVISPIINTALVIDARFNDVNDAIHTFYTSFTVGYLMAFALEIVFTTFIRLGVFALWEPEIFKLTPTIPALILPWRLRETNYLPKRITLFAADFITSCIACPIIEEFVKLKILQVCVDLPRNFRTVKRKPTKKNKRRRYAEALPRGPGEPEVTNINKYMVQMLATSLGMKLCDSSRRTLMYTKAYQQNKSFYALARGIFPIHELCGTRAALALARRDVLGVDMPLWRMLFRSVFIHGLANFRGKKPLFKWNSSTPWTEMQLSPLNVADDSTAKQLASQWFAKLTWLIILARELGGCIKNYYMISRQAVKRTTTYAGKHAAYAAELAAADVLKKTKDQKKTNKDK